MSKELTDAVLAGNDEVLASYVAANILTSITGSRLFVFISRPAADAIAAHQLRAHITALMNDHGLGIQDDEMSTRVHISYAAPEKFHSEVANIAWAPGSQIWLLFGDGTPSDVANELLDNVLAVASAKSTSGFNCTIPGGDSSKENKIVQQCGRHQIPHRIFRTAFILGDAPSSSVNHPVLHFLDTLFEFKNEIEERLPEYFEFRSLRCVAPPQANLNLISAEEAVDLMVRISRQQNSCGSYDIASPEGTSFAALCMSISMAYGFSLSLAENLDELNAIDAVFNERLAAFRESCILHRQFNPLPAYQTAAITDSIGLSRQKLVKILESVRNKQETRRAARDGRVSKLPSVLSARTTMLNNSELSYFVGGSRGTPLIVLNALGQGLEYWGRLLDRLLGYHRIIIWEPRGTFSGPQPFTMANQIGDLKAILRQEKISSCHLVGWCTGSKVALEFYLQEPQTVASMVLLNGSFKCTSTPTELQTVYEQQLDSLCQALDDAPTIASSLILSLTSGLEVNAVDLTDLDSRQSAAQVLALINRHLRQHVLSPFRDERAVLNYARQLRDFWSYDHLPKLRHVRVPVLLLSAEYDQVASPAMIRSVSELLPQVYFVHVQGATHYCLYDRPDFVAEIMEVFFLKTRSAGVHGGTQLK